MVFRDVLCVSVNFLRWLDFACGCSVFCWRVWGIACVGGGAVFMAGRLLGGYQKSCWGIWCGCHLNGYWLRFQHECKTVRVCLGEHLSNFVCLIICV